MSKSDTKNRYFGARWPLIIGFLTVFALVGGLGTWAVRAQLAGAVVSSGQIVVDKNRQVVQHPDGGVVAEVLVEEGDTVSEGDLLIRLDPTLAQSELSIVESQLYELMSRRGRLEAERDDVNQITFETSLIQEAAVDPDVASKVQGQVRLFEARKTSLQQQVMQLRAQRQQLENQIEGIDAQMTAFERQKELIKTEMDNQQSLLDRGLAQASRVLALQREEARLAGSIGELIARRAEAFEQISQLSTQELQLHSTRREEAITRMRDLQFNELEMSERASALRERLSRMEIRAPVSGVVYDMRVFGRQSVIRPADPVLFLVPQDRPLIIEARVNPLNIDEVYSNQQVVLRFSGFDMRNTPDMFGAVTRISPDAFTDQQTGIAFYRVEVEMLEEEMTKLPDGQTLIPGMPVDTFIRTEDRTPLAYLLSPLTQYFDRAFRDG
ncbi:MAG: HlyD family type I secretion periplasmic adaptor subunit [Pseudomonadota bacterium]